MSLIHCIHLVLKQQSTKSVKMIEMSEIKECHGSYCEVSIYANKKAGKESK